MNSLQAAGFPFAYTDMTGAWVNFDLPFLPMSAWVAGLGFPAVVTSLCKGHLVIAGDDQAHRQKQMAMAV